MCGSPPAPRRSLTDNLVVATILCDSASQALSDEHFVFFNQLSSPDLSVTQREQALGGDTEQVEIDLADVPAEVERIVVVALPQRGSRAAPVPRPAARSASSGC